MSLMLFIWLSQTRWLSHCFTVTIIFMFDYLSTLDTIPLAPDLVQSNDLASVFNFSRHPSTARQC